MPEFDSVPVDQDPLAADGLRRLVVPPESHSELPQIVRDLAYGAFVQPFKDAYNAATGRMTEEEQKNYFIDNLIGLAAGAGLGNPIRRAMQRGAALPLRSIHHDFPTKPPRPFGADYPRGAVADASGRLTTDIEGRPLTAKWIVGRRTLGGEDQALTPVDVARAAADVIGQQPDLVPLPGGIGGAHAVGLDPHTGEKFRRILVNDALKPADRMRVLAHETGHAVEYDAAGPGRLVKTGLMRGMSRVYHTGVTGAEDTDYLLAPEDFGYEIFHRLPEYSAEAIRAYLTNPNYLKTVAPDVAHAIRKAVNAHPTLSKIIQFNTLAATAGYELVPIDHDPYEPTTDRTSMQGF